MKKKVLLVGVYSIPEAYPPTLNAVAVLSKHFDRIYILSRNITRDEWVFPPNVQVLNTGEKISIRESERKGLAWKAWSFVLYTLNMFWLCINQQPNLVLLYDPIPFFAFNSIKKLLFSKPLIWYHNHDVLDPKLLPRFNIAKLAWQNEQKSFSELDYFSLPSEERRAYFPMSDFKGKYFFIPNLPALSFYQKFRQDRNIQNSNPIRIIYQGHIGKGHGLEGIIEYILPAEIEGKNFVLVLKGIISDDYKQALAALALQHGVSAKLEFQGFGAYQDLPLLTSGCHIGIGIHSGQDIMNKTLATASNKIYEYIALGLPVLLFDSPHYRSHFEQYPWASLTNLTEDSLVSIFAHIIQNYQSLSNRALSDFDTHFNFERNFKAVETELDTVFNKSS